MEGTCWALMWAMAGLQEVRRVTREVLQKEADLSEIVQLVGKVCCCVIL